MGMSVSAEIRRQFRYDLCLILRGLSERFDLPEDVLKYLCIQYVEEMSQYFEGRTFLDIQELSIASIVMSLLNHKLLEILVKNHRLELLTEKRQGILGKQYSHFS